jgi:hypothetical protein
MDWILEFVSGMAIWGSLALLAWGAALCVEEARGRCGLQAKRAGPSAAGAAPALPREH